MWYVQSFSTSPTQSEDLHFLSSFGITDPVDSIIGYDELTDSYNPFYDPSIPQTEKFTVILHWLSSYFEHPCFKRNEAAEIQEQSREYDSSSFQMNISDVPHRLLSTEDGYPAELSATKDLAPATRSEKGYMAVFPARLHKLIEDSFVLRSTGEGGQGMTLDFSFRVLYGTASIWPSIRGSWMLEDDVKRWRIEGKQVRDVEFRPMKGANHFVSEHWVLAQIVRPEADVGLFSSRIGPLGSSGGVSCCNLKTCLKRWIISSRLPWTENLGRHRECLHKLWSPVYVPLSRPILRLAL